MVGVAAIMPQPGPAELEFLYLAGWASFERPGVQPLLSLARLARFLGHGGSDAEHRVTPSAATPPLTFALLLSSCAALSLSSPSPSI